MSNGLTADWDLMQAINVSTVNAAIAAELKTANNAFPTSFQASVVYPGASVTIDLSGSFVAWSIQSGSGQNITFQASLTFTAASMTQNGQTRPISLAPYQGCSLSALIMIDQLYYQAQGSAQALKLAPKTQVLNAVINGMPTSGTSTAAQPISDIDFDNGGHLQDAFTNWCQSSLTAELAYAFLVMDEAQLTFAWANPTTASYSVNFPTGASDGVFAQYSMTENRIPGNTSPAVESNAIPGGSNGVLCISTDRFLQKVMINALAQQFLNASASDFQAITEPGSTMATGLTNTAELTLPSMELDSGDIVTATIPAQGVSLSIVGDQVIITIDGLTFECPDIFGIIPSGVYVTLNYNCTANLVLSNGALSLSNVNHTLNYSVTYAAAYKWLDIAIGVMTVVFAFVGLASTLQGARTAAATATQDAEVVSGEVSNTATGSVTVTGVEDLSANISELTSSVNSGRELSQDAIQQMDTVVTDTNTVARGTGSVSFGYITRVIFRLILLGGAGYGLYNAVSWNIVGNLVKVLDDGDPVDPPTLEDFSANLLKPVTWTNVKAGWSVAGAAMDDGVQLNLSFTSPG